MATKKTQKAPISKTKTVRVGRTQKSSSASLLSSKRVLLTFVVAFAVIGGLIVHYSQAAVDPKIDAAQSNQKAYEAIKASAAAVGDPIPETKASLTPKPADFGQPKTVDPTGSDRVNTSTTATAGADAAVSARGIPRPADLPPFPQPPTNVKPLSSSNGSWLFPKAHADSWTRAYTIAYARQFIGWQGKHFFYYGTFPNGDNWCSDFVSYVNMRAGVPFWEGYDGWRMPYSGTVANFMWRTGSLRFPGQYRPTPGDLVFFNWPNTAERNDHIGLVESIDAKGTITTIEGNIGNDNQWESVVGRRTYSGNDSRIIGYGRWY